MSISMKTPTIEQLPNMFSEQFVIDIQRNVQTPQQLFRTFSSYQPQIQPNKNLPIVKQQFFKQLLKKQPIQQSLSFLYAYMTQHIYSVQQKFHVLNLVYKLIYLISEICMTKQLWKTILQKELNKLKQMLSLPQQESNNNQTICHPQILSVFEIEQLKVYIDDNITKFYSIWDKILDQNQKYTIHAQFYHPVGLNTYDNQKLTDGKKLEVNEILALGFLKDFISDKPPVQQKKDPKKK